MARLPHLLRLVAVVAVSLTPIETFAQEPTKERLTSTRLEPLRDVLGFTWDLNSQGAIGNGSNNCFDGACRLRVNGGDFPGGRPMTPSIPGQQPNAADREYVFTANIGELAVTRRMRLDPADGWMRYIELVENRQDRAVPVELVLLTEMASSAASVTSEGDQPFSGQLGKKEGCLVVRAVDNRPGVVFVLCDPRSGGKPQVSVNNNRTFTATFKLQVAAKSTAAVVHYIAQRPSATGADARVMLKKIVRQGKIIDPALPALAAGRITNFSEKATESLDLPAALDTLRQLTNALDIEREEKDTLVIDAETRLAGTITGGELEVATAFGKTKVPFDEVAAISGGAGVQQTPRVFLRDGEILLGAVTGGVLSMTTDTGLKLEPKVSELRLAALRKSPAEGNAPAGTIAFLTTHRGDCLALAEKSALEIPATTPWGAVKIPLREIRRLVYARDPFPSHRFALTDGSQFLAMLATGDWPVDTPRFGRVSVAPQDVREIRESAAGNELAAPEAWCSLVGENRLTGRLDVAQLRIVNAAGAATPIERESIARIERDETGSVSIQLADGQTVKGNLEDPVLPFRAEKRVWRVPLAHITAVQVSAPAKPAEQPPAP